MSNQEQPLRDVINQALSVVEKREEARHQQRVQYFRQCAEDVLCVQQPDVYWRVASVIKINISDPKDDATVLTLWTVTMVQDGEQRLGVTNLIFQDCAHDHCKGHLLRMAQDYLVRAIGDTSEKGPVEL